MHSEGKPVNGPVIKKAKPLYDEMKVTYKCMSSQGCLWSFEEPAGEGCVKMKYSSDWMCSHSIGAVTKKNPVRTSFRMVSVW